MRLLDLSAGLRQIWHNKQFPDVIYLDIRPCRKPTIVADSRNLPFAADTFDHIVFDPPHKNTGGTGIFGDLYGHYTHAEIHQLTRETAREIARVLRPNGTVCVKIATQNIKLTTWLAHLAPLEIRYGSHVKANRRGGTFWITCTRRQPTKETK